MLLNREQKLEDIQKIIGYEFKDLGLLKMSLTHRSYFHQKDKELDIKDHNERLEFLGDAVLELIITDYLFQKFSQAEGFLTSLRSALVNFRNIGQIGYNLDLENALYLGKSELESGNSDKLVIVANAVEALIGAIFLDGGYDAGKIFILKHVVPTLENILKEKSYRDSKTEFQELVQKVLKITPKYKLLQTEGKDHEKTFLTGVFVGEKLIATGLGKSKQEAETEAAKKAIVVFQNRENE